jgi:hypothetical protein
MDTEIIFKENSTEIKEASVYFDYKEAVDIIAAHKFFHENGIQISQEALEHNFEAWCQDYKSGYRDEAAGYHVFSPCGCNPLRFTLTPLSEKNSAWQNTYEA